LCKTGTVLQYSCPGTSEQSGYAERNHRHILDIVYALLMSASCPKIFCAKAALTAVYNVSLLPSPVIGNQSPHDRLFDSTPNYNMLRVFGCACFVLL